MFLFEARVHRRSATVSVGVSSVPDENNLCRRHFYHQRYTAIRHYLSALRKLYFAT